jgi:hypothetical protein
MATPEPVYPVAIKLSVDVTAYVGYADDRVRIEVATGIPLVNKISLWMDAADLPAVERVVIEQKKWMNLPRPYRFLKGAKK